MLNDDCIYKILEWLPIDDLCTFNRTCTRIRGLCDDYFHQKLSKLLNKEVIVRFDETTVECEMYVKCFNNFIKNLRIDCCGNVDFNVVVNFIKTKCDPNVRKLGIRNFKVLAPNYKEIASFLQSAETVEFYNLAGSGRNQSALLKYCPNLTTISMRGYDTDSKVTNFIFDDIFEEKYPKLQHLHLLKVRPEYLKKLKSFLREHNSIKCMEWISFFDSDIYGQLQCIKAVVDLALNLEHLYLKVDENDFETICRYLEVICARDNFKSLYLQFRNEFCDPTTTNLLKSNASQLASFKQLTKISIKSWGLRLTDLIKALGRYVHLKSIELIWYDCVEMIMWPLKEIPPIDTLPQIEEFTIIGRSSKEETLMFLMQFARYWVNLKKVTVYFEHYDVKQLIHVAELNEARMKLENPCELTIFTNAKGNETNLNHELVKLKCVELEQFDSFERKCMVSFK